MNWSFSQQSQVIVQGISELKTINRVLQLKAYGTNIVAAISPGKSQHKVGDIPIFDLVETAVAKFGQIETSLIFVPPYQVLDAGREAIAAGIQHLIIFTTEVPPLDTISLLKCAEANNTSILGPSSQGFIIPERVWLGTLQPQFYMAGTVGLISSSLYLSYEVAWELNQAQMGQSIVVCLGKDKIVGSNLSQWLAILNSDVNTQAIVLIGHAIDNTEEITSFYGNSDSNKPLIIYLAGLQAPQEKVFRDAVTIITNNLSSSIPVANTNKQAIYKLKQAGIKIARNPYEIPTLVKSNLSSDR